MEGVMAKRALGKFDNNLDSYAHGVTMDGGVDEELSLPDGGGWYGLILLDDDTRKAIRKAAEEHVALDEDEDACLDESAAVILFERSDGIVEADWFDDKEDAEGAWEEIEEEFEEEEEEHEEEEDEEEEEEEEIEGEVKPEGEA